jgi:hypothetical protein
MSKLQNLSDSFSGNIYDPTLWIETGALNKTIIVNNQLQISTTAGASQYNQLQSLTTYDLTDSYAFVEVIDVGNQNLASFEVILNVKLNDNYKLYFTANSFQFTARKIIAGVNSAIASIGYNNSAMRFWRIRETSGTVYFEYSDTGATWTTLTSLATPFAMTAVYAEMQVGNYSVEATSSTGTFDNFNVTSALATAAVGVLRKHYFYKVYSSGTYVDTWVQDVISEPDFRVNINGGAGELTIRLAREFDNFGEDVDVKLNNKVECYCVDRDNPNGLLIYTGYISGYKPVLRGVEEYIEVTLFNFVSELQRTILRDSSGNTTLTYNSYDPANILKDVIDKLRTLGVSINYSATSIALTNTTVSYTFNTNTGKEAIDKIIELCPIGWYWRVDPDNTIYLQPKNILSDHTFTIGKEIENLETYRRIEDLVNTVFFTGSGDPALFLKYQNTSSQNTYGKYERKIVDQRVSVSATASILSNRLIDSQKDPEIRSRFTIVDNNGPSSTLGYNIESIKVGQTLKVANLRVGSKTETLWDVGFWDTDVWDQTLSTTAADVIQILSLSYRPDSIVIEASSRLPQIAKRIEDINRNLENSQTVANPTAPS